MGMYRSLLHQILQQDQGVRHQFLKYYRTKKETYGPWNIHENQLRNSISLHFSTPIDKPIYLFIDALDECKEDEVRSVVNYFRELTDAAYAAGNHMSVCMSSRRYPTISIARCPEINVEDGNRSDVSKYVRQKIMSHGDRTVPESLIMSVDNKASHVFLWAVLVIEMLLREWDNGTPLRELEAMLHQIPQEIEKVFDELTSNLTHQERPEALRLFQWVLLSIEPLSLGSLQYAIIFGEEKHPKSFREVFESEGEFESRQFARRITYLSRGLIEAVKKPFGKGTFIVQVIHESVRDWFLNYGGFVRLDAMLHTFPIEKGHIQIIQACMNIMQTTDFLEMHPERDQIEAPYWQPDRDHTGRNVNFKKRNDVLGITDYCANRIFGHAQRLDKSGTIPTHFLELLTKPQSLLWADMRKAYTQDMELQSHPPTHSLLTLLCSKGFEASVSWLLGGSKGQRVGPNAMKAAIRGRHFAVLDILDSHSPLSSIIDENGRNAFHFACELLTSFPHTSIQEMIRLLLRKGLDVNSRDNMGMTGFMIAVDVDRLDLLQVLFDAGACPDVQDGRGRTALHIAVERGKSLIIKNFFETNASCGTNIDVQDNFGRTALHLAVQNGLSSAVVELLESSASPLVQDNEGQIPLHKAAVVGYSECVGSLLAHPSGPSTLNIKDVTGSTPLHLAALCSSEILIKILVLAGADVNCSDETGQTPLHIAARKIDLEVLAFMVSNGADRTVKDRFGMTAVDHAESVGRGCDVLDFLDPRFGLG